MRSSAAGGTSLSTSAISGDAKFNTITLALFSGGDIGSNNLDLSGISGKTTINTLTATRGNIKANTDFNITTLDVKTADFTATTSLEGNDSTNFNITNLQIFGGWGSTNKATALFSKGKTLNIDSAKISDYSTLDASTINDVQIKNLESRYATIKAGEKLKIENAKFSNNETYLYTDANKGSTHIGNISLDNGAKLYIKQGNNLSADNLVMQNGSSLVAQANNTNGNMSGDTSIKHISFNASSIYANNLSTEDITITGDGNSGANIYLKNDSTGLYTNLGTATLTDGSKLSVHGNMSNAGSLKITLNPNNSELIHTTGYFNFNMDSDPNKTITITDENGSPHTISAPKSSIDVYANSKTLIAGKTYTLIQADGGIGFLQNNKTYNTSSSGEDAKTYASLSNIQP